MHTTRKAVILAVDLGTTFGWALRDAEDGWKSGETKIDRPQGAPYGLLFLLFREQMAPVFREWAGEGTLVYERPGMHAKGGARLRILIGMETVLQELAAAHRWARVWPVSPNTLKKFMAGSGTADKARMVKAAERVVNRPVTSDHEADAIALREWALAKLL